MASSLSYGAKIPVLDGNNFSLWKTQMEALLHKSRLLKIVKGRTPAPAEPAEYEKWEEKDQDARADILIALAPKIVNLVKGFGTSKQIWDFLEETYNRKSTRQKVEVYRKIVNFKMSSGQNFADYLEQFDIQHTRLQEIGGKVEEELAVVILLDGLTDEYKEIKAAFNTVNDVPSLATMRSRLLELDTSIANKQTDDAMKAKFQRRNYGTQDVSGMSKRNFKCFRCGKPGHFAKNCKTKPNDRQINMVNNGFVVHHITNEFSYQIQQNGKWFFDSGATSHMTFEEKYFENLDKNYQGTVKLADEKELQVKGIGTVVFQAKIRNRTKEVRLMNTIWVPELKASLISASKATDSGCSINMKDQKAIISREGNVLVEAYKTNGLYVVHAIDECAIPVMENQLNNLELWHKRFGHLHFQALRELQTKNMVKGMPKFGK